MLDCDICNKIVCFLIQSVPCTQDVGVDEFQRGAWQTMINEMGDSDIISSYNIATVLRKVCAL